MTTKAAAEVQAPTLDADIASIMAEVAESPPTLTEDPAEETTAEATTEEAPADEENAPAAKDSAGIDYAKLTEAVDASDLPGFLAALGPAADKLLSSKAHKALRLQAKELTKETAKAKAAEAKAQALATKLGEKYSDPIAVRKAVTEGSKEAVDVFIDYAEKTAGTDWNSIMRWVTKGLAGRPERLATKAKAETEAKVADTTARDAAVKQAKDWCVAEVTKTHAAVLTDAPELADMVLDEIRQGYHSGVTSPAKALPLALKKLQAQHGRLTKALATVTKATKKESAPAPSRRAYEVPTAPRTAPRSLSEDIADFMKDNNLRSR